jgi:hypothetical protein
MVGFFLGTEEVGLFVFCHEIGVFGSITGIFAGIFPNGTPLAQPPPPPPGPVTGTEEGGTGTGVGDTIVPVPVEPVRENPWSMVKLSATRW